MSEVGVDVGGGLQRLEAPAGDVDLVAGEAQRVAEHVDEGLLVVDHQQPGSPLVHARDATTRTCERPGSYLGSSSTTGMMRSVLAWYWS